MSMNDTIKTAEEHLLHTYNRYPIVFDHGNGVRLYDDNGKEYLDFCAGIAVYAIGYGNKRYEAALKSQIEKICHTSNYYYSKPLAEAAKALTEAAKLPKVFFTNSGAEAVEGAIKAARKYAYLKDKKTDHEIIAMQHSFHGRTFGALSVTGNDHYREPFEPMIGNVKFADFNDLDSVRALVNDRTCAIIMETVQGEGGIFPADKEFITGVRKLCDDNDILLILDEIQCGMGRCGSMYAFMQYGVQPDILTTAKAVGCGIPVGAFLLNEKTASSSLVPGDHGTTYGGNPLACAAVAEVFRIFEEDGIIDNVNKVAPYLKKRLEETVASHDCLIAERGLGLMRGIVFDTDKKKPADVVSAALSKGLVLITAGPDVIRFLPPLIISEADVDEMIDKLNASLAE
ncbi:MAG: aspartate aminotransferase family protein [Lachnospiraceae bacterium]|nr:aspartate aminotransferase family protein [Lachnospiraceae bacterium]